MEKSKREFCSSTSYRPPDADPYDDTEWLDWDRWHAAEEYQDLLDGLFHADDSDATNTRTFKDGEWDENVVRQFHRQGLEIEV